MKMFLALYLAFLAFALAGCDGQPEPAPCAPAPDITTITASARVTSLASYGPTGAPGNPDQCPAPPWTTVDVVRGQVDGYDVQVFSEAADAACDWTIEGTVSVYTPAGCRWDVGLELAGVRS